MSVPQVFNFQDKFPVRVEVVDGKEWFCVKDVCDILEIQNPTQSISRLKPEHKTMFNIGRQGDMSFISEPGLFKLLFSSRKEKAEEFQDWVFEDVLPQLRATGQYAIRLLPPPEDPLSLSDKGKLLKLHIQAWKFLSVSDSSKLMLTQKFFLDNGIDSPTLPDYTSSKGIKCSASELLKKNQLQISAQKFNKVLLDCGYLEKKERSSRKYTGKIKTYWHLTKRGQEFGENDVSPQNPKETQPNYYEHTFLDLMQKAGM